MSIPISQFIPSPPLPPGNLKFLFYICLNTYLFIESGVIQTDKTLCPFGDHMSVLWPPQARHTDKDTDNINNPVSCPLLSLSNFPLVSLCCAHMCS